MVSTRTAAFFALIVACASHVFASPLPAFERESRDISPFQTIKAYQKRAFSLDGLLFGKRAGGINTMPAEMATMSDGTAIKPYSRRQVDITDTADTTGGANTLAAPSDSIIVPAEVAVSSDGTGPVPIRKRAGGINTMPAEMATMSDGTAIKPYSRRQLDDTTDDTTDPTDPLDDTTDTTDTTTDPTTDTTGTTGALLATPEESITVPAEVAVSSDGSGPVPIGKRASGINTMPAEMATTSDGTAIKAYGV